MHSGLNDSEIIQRVLAGDHQAYGELVERHKDYVFTLVLRIVRVREDAEEVAQDVFIKAYRYLADFKGNAKFTTWIYTIANNTSISFLRKKRPETVSMDDEKVFAAADHRDSGMKADQVEQKSRQAMVNRAIGMLSPDDARMITLFYKGEQSLEEIATVLGIETNAAKVRLHRARTRLKEKMETYFPAEVRDLY